MASELMYIKSKLLLPRINEEEDPRERLAAAILEYKRAKEASQKLGSLYAIYNGRMEKDTDEISADRSYVAEHDINLLSIAIMKIMNNVKISDEEASEKIKPLISTRTVSVNERVFAILRILLMNNGRVNVLRCFEGITTKHELVATFMAILEMLKAGRVLIKEDEIEYSETGVIELENNIFIELFDGKIRSLGDENDG
jgi:segregation and condensation protein A